MKDNNESKSVVLAQRICDGIAHTWKVYNFKSDINRAGSYLAHFSPRNSHISNVFVEVGSDGVIRLSVVTSLPTSMAVEELLTLLDVGPNKTKDFVVTTEAKLGGISWGVNVHFNEVTTELKKLIAALLTNSSYERTTAISFD